MSSSSRPQPAPKRPSGGRPIRRLFSKDTLPSLTKNGHTRKASAESTATGASVDEPLSRIPTQFTPLTETPTEFDENKPWTDKGFTSTPPTPSEYIDETPAVTPALERPPRPPLPRSSSSSYFPNVPATKQSKVSIESLPVRSNSPTPSTSRARWDHLRHHVLPVSRSASPNPSFTSFSQLNLPTGSATAPRPSRLAARLGFRQVVTEAREAAAIQDDLMQKFGEDIQRAVLNARFGDTRRPKPEREATQHSLGSTLHLPFMSSTSLPVSAATSMNDLSLPGPSKFGARGTLATTQPAARLTALTHLQDVIIRYVSAINMMPKDVGNKFIPHEKDVLSVILIAFLNQSTGHIAEDERRISFQIFNTIVQFWRNQADGDVERCVWCCKALTMPPSPLRSRLLELLGSMIAAQDSPLTTVAAFQTIVARLVLLIPHLDAGQYGDASDLVRAEELIGKIISGECGQLDLGELEHQYNIGASHSDENRLRQGICVEAVVRCLDFGALEQKRHVLRAIDKYWSSHDDSMTSTALSVKVHSHKISTFLRSTLDTLHEAAKKGKPSLRTSDVSLIMRLLNSKALPELAALSSSSQPLSDIRALAVQVALALLSAEVDIQEHEDNPDDTFADPKVYGSKRLLMEWLEGGSLSWRDCIHKELREFAAKADWEVVIHIAANVTAVLPESTRKNAIGLIIPSIQERLIQDAPQRPNENLSQLLATFAAACPQIFYKPLFLCAASSKDESIARQLAALVWLSHFMPNFGISDAEMVAVALMSDPGGGASLVKQKTKEGQFQERGKARIGQMIIFLEVIERLRGIRLEHGEVQEMTASGAAVLNAAKFATALEARLTVLIEAKEHTVHLPLIQRILLAALLLEVRLLTRSLKSAKWLSRLVAWTIQLSVKNERDSFDLPPMTQEILDELEDSQDRIETVYSMCKAGMKPANQRRSTMLLSPTFGNASGEAREDIYGGLLQARLGVLKTATEQPVRPFLELLVAMCGALKHEDFAHLGPFVWNECLELDDERTVINACFICMQCAEKAHDRFQDFLLKQLQSVDPSVRREALKRLSILSGWRYQLLSLTYITDKSFRRPFKLARPPLNFVATDVGDSKYIPDNEAEETIQGQRRVLPLDLKRRLNEIGWEEEDKPQDQRLQWLRTPMSLLGSNQLYLLSSSASLTEDLSDAAPSPLSSPRSSPSKSPSLAGGAPLLRRNSSSGGQLGIKRRPVFVQPLIPIFLTLAKLTLDKDFVVSSIARDLIMDYMREDPALLCRPVMDILSGNIVAIDEAVTALQTFLHVQHILPPRLTHYVFNYLAGFLKMLAKEQTLPEALRDMCYVVGILSKLAPQVSDMTIRAIRRAKIEVFLFPSGSLYFHETSPHGPMFPKGPSLNANPFDDVSSSVLNLSMIRMSQSLLFVELLKRSPQDVSIVRKGWTPLELPEVVGLRDGSALPQRSPIRSIPPDSQTSFSLSLSYSRSHLLFIAQLLRCLTRHLSDRVELINFLDGVNRILMRHGDDIGIVGHALIAYMIASTRFRRLMGSGTGFTIFLPILFKVYCEADGDPGIREAIEYAFHRFHAVHEESFVYQALQVISRLVAQPSVDGEWVSSNAYQLLYSLKSVPTTQDAAGIRDANKAQEEETALAISADERPQVFLASLRKDGKAASEKLQSTISAEFFENKRFQPDNIIKMLLTVIAHDPAVKRAEHFVRLFRFLTPHLYNASNTARNVLRDGIDALGNIITNKVATKVKTPDPANINGERMSIDEERPTNLSSENSSSPCDMHAMRSDYLLLFVSYAKSGGNYRPTTLQRALDLTKLILKESSVTSAGVESIRIFMDQLAQTFTSRDDPKYTVSILKELAPIVSAHGGVLDLTGLLQSLVGLSSNPNFANDPKFSKIVVNQICSSVLDICEMAAQENILATLKFRLTFVNLLARAVCLCDTDIIADLEGREPSPVFLSYIMLPFLFRLHTRTEFGMEIQWTDNWRQDAFRRAWVRLFVYAMTTFQNPSSGNMKSARGSIRKSPSFNFEAPAEGDADVSKLSLRKPKRQASSRGNVAASMRLAMAFLTLKAVILRGEDDISALLPNAWSLVGALLRSTLRDGSALFAFHGQSGSATPSPMPSPIASTSFSELMNKRSESPFRVRSTSSASEARLHAPSSEGHSTNHTSRPTSPARVPARKSSTRSFPCPRFVDYLTWSLLEFICLRRSPLVIQLRTYMNEKLVQLHETLVTVEYGSPALGELRPRRASRPISSMYAKPRQSFRASSLTVTPEGSPRLGPADLNNSYVGNLGSLPSLSSLGSPEFNAFTSSPRLLKGRRPIIHLGTAVSPAKSLLSPSLLPQSTSANSGLSALQSGEDVVAPNDAALDTRQTLAATELRSSALARATFERVRVVQKCLGYVDFLPFPKALSKAAPAGADRSPFADPSPALGGASPRTSFILSREAMVDPDPEPRAWTKRSAAEAIMKEARELMHAWQAEATIAISTSDAGHGDGALSARASLDELDATFVSASDANPVP